MARGRGELTPKDIEFRKMISNNINKLLEQYNKKQTDIHNATGIPKSTLTGYIKGTSTPNQGNIQKISDFFGVKKSDIDPRFSSDLKKQNERKLGINSIYSQLSPPRQEKVYNFVEEQLEEQQKENVLEFPNKGKIPTVHNSASAANPTELAYGDTVVEEEEFERVPSNADFAVPIIGDSMEPVIKNGQFVFVKEQPDVEDGEIAIVELDGDGVTCKEIYKDYENRTIILRSINELYEDRIVTPEQIRIIGKVVFY